MSCMFGSNQARGKALIRRVPRHLPPNGGRVNWPEADFSSIRAGPKTCILCDGQLGTVAKGAPNPTDAVFNRQIELCVRTDESQKVRAHVEIFGDDFAQPHWRGSLQFVQFRNQPLAASDE